MNVYLFGTSYKFTPIKDFEPIYINKHCVKDFYKDTSFKIIQEIAILSTCNRFECYVIADDEDGAFDELCYAISVFNSVSLDTTKTLMTGLRALDPVDHLFSVASGIESMVFGENEILTQVKDSQYIAQEASVSGAYLNKLFQSAVACGKRVRSETQISKGAYSVSSIAIEAIREKIFDYFGRSILIIGAGTMGGRAIKKLYALGHPDIFLTNRTLEKAQALGDGMDITVVPFEEALSHMGRYDIIITATGTKTPILTKDHFKEKQAQLIIDLGVPRNVNVDGSDMDVVTVGGLKEIADKNIMKRKSSLDNVLTIIKEEIAKLAQWVDYKQRCVNTSN